MDATGEQAAARYDTGPSWPAPVWAPESGPYPPPPVGAPVGPPAAAPVRRVNSTLAWAVLWLGLGLVALISIDESWFGPLNVFVFGTPARTDGFLGLGVLPAQRLVLAALSVLPFLVAAQIGARSVGGRLVALLAVVVAAGCYALVPYRGSSGTWWVPVVGDVVLFVGWLAARSRSWPAYLTVLPAVGVALVWNLPIRFSRDVRMLHGHLPYRSTTLTAWWVLLAEFVALGVIGLLAAVIGPGRRARSHSG